MTIASASPDTIVRDTDLAALAGVSARRIRELAEAGTLERIERGRYLLGPSIRALLDAASNSGVSAELNRERVRKVRADANRAELDYAIAKREVAPLQEMQRAMEVAFATVRANMRQLPSRLIAQLVHEGDEERWKRVMLAEIDAALVAVSDAEIDFLNESQTTDEDHERH